MMEIHHFGSAERIYSSGFSLLGDLVMKPDFPPGEFERIEADYQGRLKLEAGQPRARAVKELQTRIFGTGHPYAQPYTGSGTEEALARLAVEDLREFHDTWYQPDNVAVVVVGDLTLEEARSAVHKAFGSWKGKSPAARPCPSARDDFESRVVVLDRPGSSQSMIVGGFAGLQRAHPDRKAFQLLNHALGGNYSGRINRNLRSEKGYTYGARSRLVSFREAGFFLIEASVQKEHTAESLSELIREIDEIGSTRPLEGEELARARNAQVAGFPRQFETLKRVATSLDRMLTCGMRLDDWQTTRSRITSCDAGRMMEMARQNLDSRQVIWVIVGDWEEMKSSLNGLDLGKIAIIRY